MNESKDPPAEAGAPSAAASGRRFRFVAADRIIAPLAIFFGVYLATFYLGSTTAAATGFWYPQWIGLFSVTVATAVIVQTWERGSWRIGLAAPATIVSREILFGVAFAAALIVACDLLVLASTDMHHARGGGFPWMDLAGIFVPAAVHEELLFRGYVFQKLRRWRRLAAYFFSAIVFAALHATNTGISPLAYVNLAIAGVLLGLAYERRNLLWFPMGIHLAWNILSGPVLGHEVSGYVASATVFRTLGEGAVLFTGGDFGIEASIWMTLCELVGVALLWKKNLERRTQNEEFGRQSV